MADHLLQEDGDLILLEIDSPSFLLEDEPASMFHFGSQVLDYVEMIPASGFLNVPHGLWGDGPDFPNTAWIQGHPLLFDGSTTVRIEFYIQTEPDFHSSIAANLYDGNTDLGAITSSGTGGGSGDVTRSNFTCLGVKMLNPTAGTHTYAIRLYSVTGLKNNVYSGPNTIGPDTTPDVAPSYYMVTRF